MMIALWMGLAVAGEVEKAPAGVYELLRLRDDAGCAALGTPDERLRGELVRMTVEQPEPAWVSVRAASCLVGLYGADATLPAIVEPWFTDPERRGLALIVASRLGDLPEASAVEVARAAMRVTDEGWRARFVGRMERSGVAGVMGVLRGE